MKSIVSVFFLFVSATLLGCAHLTGVLFTAAETPVAATSNPAGTREGLACTTSFLGLFAFGNSGIEAARQNGAITEISTVDLKRVGVPFLYFKSCTVVRGR